MVPKFEDFFLPCLKCLSDGNICTQESLRKYVVDYFHLFEADVNVLIRSGKKHKLLTEYHGLYPISCKLV